MITKQHIKDSLDKCIVRSQLPLAHKYSGKVRDMYFHQDKAIIVCTDRQSAFDRILGAIPFKGQVLAYLSWWWFQKTRHIVKNHLIAHPDPNVIIAKRCDVFPIEFIVRGYITGSTSTSLWTQYKKGVRTYCGIQFPDGLVKNQPLGKAILTPTTKEEKHDKPISEKDIISQKIMTESQLHYISDVAIKLFTFGQREAEKCGLILVDTKYEFGIDQQTGDIMLIDEIHTPDSSRFWIKSTYEKYFSKGQEPENFDKEFFRLWFVENCDPYGDMPLPPAPEHLVVELSHRYIQHCQMITKHSLEPLEANQDIDKRIEKNVNQYIGQ